MNSATANSSTVEPITAGSSAIVIPLNSVTKPTTATTAPPAPTPKPKRLSLADLRVAAAARKPAMGA